MTTFRRISPILVVDDVAPCAEFWERLGFTRTAELPLGEAGGGVGFAVLVKDALEVMYQSAESVRAGNAASADALFVGGSCLYVEVADLESTLRAVDGAPVVVPRRTTRFGMEECGVKDPGGHVILFSQRV